MHDIGENDLRKRRLRARVTLRAPISVQKVMVALLLLIVAPTQVAALQMSKELSTKPGQRGLKLDPEFVGPASTAPSDQSSPTDLSRPDPEARVEAQTPQLQEVRESTTALGHQTQDARPPEAEGNKKVLGEWLVIGLVAVLFAALGFLFALALAGRWLRQRGR